MRHGKGCGLMVWPRCLLLFELLLVAAILLLPAFSRAASENIEGRIFGEAGPLERARVYVYKSYQDISAKKPFLSSNLTDEQGSFKLQLKPGEYYFTARGNHNGKTFFSYHGGNPLKVSNENLWISLMTNEETLPVYSDGATSIQGIVTFKGEPVKGAHVAFYPLGAKNFKGFGFLADKGFGFMRGAQDDGSFEISVSVPGKYVVIARKVEGKNGIMPLKKGDLFCYAPSNPIDVLHDKAVRIELPCYPKADRFSFVETPKIKPPDYHTLDRVADGAQYGIKGKVVDVEGSPVPGVYVVAFLTGDHSRLVREAESIAKTDANGDYFIPLNTDGHYGLVVRSALGGPPKLDEFSGLYGEDPWKGTPFKAGEQIINFNISIKDKRPQQ